MSLILDKPRYLCEPIRNLDALASALKVPLDELCAIAKLANRSYSKVPVKPSSKPTKPGAKPKAERECFNARPRLKAIHKKIKEEIFHQVYFPMYLTGSIKGRDYVLNAEQHQNKSVLICEDVKKFFPSVRADRVKDVWLEFFGFSDDVASLLTQLSTKDGGLPQGAITSSYLANLVFFRDEPLLHAKLAERGIDYSRYVDDMAMSSKLRLPKSVYTQCIADVFGMLRRNGLYADRQDKHKFFTASTRMFLTNLLVNAKPALPRAKRRNARAAVFQLERRVAAGELTPEVSQLISKTSHVVGNVGRLHKNEADPLKKRLKQVRESVQTQGGIPFITTSEAIPAASDNKGVPWE
jgi:hypothetical protein